MAWNRQWSDQIKGANILVGFDLLMKFTNRKVKGMLIKKSGYFNGKISLKEK